MTDEARSGSLFVESLVKALGAGFVMYELKDGKLTRVELDANRPAPNAVPQPVEEPSIPMMEVPPAGPDIASTTSLKSYADQLEVARFKLVEWQKKLLSGIHPSAEAGPNSRLSPLLAALKTPSFRWYEPSLNQEPEPLTTAAGIAARLRSVADIIDSMLASVENIEDSLDEIDLIRGDVADLLRERS